MKFGAAVGREFSMASIHPSAPRQHRTPRVVRFGFVALLVILATLFAITLFEAGESADAQAGPSPAGCGGDYANSFGSVAFNTVVGDKLLSSSPTTMVWGLGSPIPAGTYDLSGVSYDGYTDRATSAGQFNEQWFAEFLDASGNVLATSGITGDLADNVTEATWSGGIGRVTLSATATQIRTVHAAIGSAAINSVRPVCVGASSIAPPATTPPATAPPETTPPDTAPPATTPPDTAPPSGQSSITVQKIIEGDNDFKATLTLDCGVNGSASGTDNNPSISVGDLPIGASCDISVEADDISNIGFEVTPASIIPIAGDALSTITITIPEDGLNIVVSITCAIEGGGDVDPEPPTTQPPTTQPPTTQPPTTQPPTTQPPTPRPAQQPAQPAEPVAANPNFTG